MPREKKVIDEVSELFSSPEVFQSDVAEAFGLMREHLHNKYTGKMLEAIESYKSEVNKNPSAEVQLLKAFKPFMDETSNQKLDELARAIQSYNVIKQMRGSFANVTANESDSGLYAQSIGDLTTERNSSVHPDGVYDIDEQCYVNSHGRTYQGGSGGMAGVLMLMAAMGNRK